MQPMLILFHSLSQSSKKTLILIFVAIARPLDQLIPNNCKTKMKLILELEAYAIWNSLLLNEFIESCSFRDG